MELAVCGQAFNCEDGGPICLHGKHCATLDSLPVQLDRAGPAERCFTTHVRPGQPHDFTEIMDEKQPRRHVMGMAFSVDFYSDVHGHLLGRGKSGGWRRYQKLWLEATGIEPTSSVPQVTESINSSRSFPS